MQNGQWKRRHRNTRYRRFRWERLLLVAASAALVVVGLVKLIRYTDDYISAQQTAQELRQAYQQEITETAAPAPSPVCLLYTSDAADDMKCVDLGGRRIIKNGIIVI